MKKKTIRQIFLDTETTGINKSGIHYDGHNIIEIGAVEAINRRLTGKYFHVYIRPGRLIDFEAFKIHGISDNFLKNKPYFYEIADSFLNFIHGSEIIIHNAPFDVGFIDYEFSKLNKKIFSISKISKITDSLKIARKIFPGKKNNLNALCARYHINNSKRSLHGALLDAKLLAKVYMAMTGGQISLNFSNNSPNKVNNLFKYNTLNNRNKKELVIINADKKELIEHEKKLDLIEKKSKKRSIWRLINK